jgi:hypothetical protein
MQLVYNSDNFVVVAFEVTPRQDGTTQTRGGYEIVDKLARTEIFIEGDLAQTFQQGVQALVDAGPTEEDIDAFIGRFTGLSHQPVTMH